MGDLRGYLVPDKNMETEVNFLEGIGRGDRVRTEMNYKPLKTILAKNFFISWKSIGNFKEAGLELEAKVKMKEFGTSAISPMNICSAADTL